MQGGEVEEQAAAKGHAAFSLESWEREEAFSGLGEWLGRTKWPLESCLLGLIGSTKQ